MMVSQDDRVNEAAERFGEVIDSRIQNISEKDKKTLHEILRDLLEEMIRKKESANK